MIDTFLKAFQLKEEKRTGWELRKVENPETVADHSWGTAFLVLVHGEKEEIDVDKAVKIAIVHDLGEAEVGDIAHRAVDANIEISKEEKNRREKEAIEELSELKPEIKELWKEYEEKETREAKFVKDMDMIEMCIQALKYEKDGRYNPEEQNENFQKYDNMDEFFATTEPRLKTETGKKLFGDIKLRYENVKSVNSQS